MSTWNMPPGVTTNDIPGNGSDDRLEAEYIKRHGEMMLDTVVDTWMDQLPFPLKSSVELRDKLISLLASQWTELEIAEAAAVLTGGPNFETWYGDQE